MHNYFLAICWPTQFFESLKVHDLKIDNRNIHYAVALSTVLQLSHFALWPMGKMLLGPHVFFSAVPHVATGINLPPLHIANSVSISYNPSTH